MGLRLLLLLLILATPFPACAGTVEMVIGSPDEPPQAGLSTVLTLYFHNTGDTPVSIAADRELTFHLASQNRSWDLVGKKIEAGKDLTPVVGAKEFIRTQYELTLPENVHGMVYLSVPRYDMAARYLSVKKSHSNAQNRFAWLPETTDLPMDTLIQLYQPYARNLSYYRPIYFLVGTEPENSKFQISFKYRFFSKNKLLVQNKPWLQGFHFGYTQTSFWDLASDSLPFEDTSYKPELFYTSQGFKTRWPLLDGHFFRTGIRHESNGRGGELSRSTNTIYIEPNFIFYNEQWQTGLRITPRIWTYVGNEDENNPDLADYRGYFNLGIAFGRANSLVLDTNLRWADQGGSIQVDLTHPLHTLFFSHLDMYLQVQYVNQLAESLIEYTKREEAFRIGLAFVR